ncbi:MAG: hypothetical protein M1396_05170 [Chloroflexi bacterium]|nr:hypothetical protein [Chloroflexota bacterium]
MVQCHAILLRVFPAIAADGVEGLGELLQRLSERWFLCWHWLQNQAYRSLHTAIYHMRTILCRLWKEEASVVTELWRVSRWNSTIGTLGLKPSTYSSSSGGVFVISSPLNQ